jgi:hypothetical protein
MTEPIFELLTRREEQSEIDKLLLNFSSLIEEAVNFGTHILKWELNELTGGDENVPIGLTLRHILDLFDSVSVLVRNSCADPCKLILRGALEAQLGLEYILQNDTKNRSLGFLVCYYHNELKLLLKVKPGEQGYDQLLSKMNADKSIPKGTKPPIILNLDNYIDNLKSLLAMPLYIQAEIEYQTLIKKGVKNPNWFQLFNGPRNIEQLANTLNRQALYEVLYRGWSSSIHGTEVIKNKLHQSIDGNIEITQLRHLKDVQSITKITMTLAIMCYKVMIERRIPNHTQDFAQWSATIQKDYQKITNEELLVVE